MISTRLVRGAIAGAATLALSLSTLTVSISHAQSADDATVMEGGNTHLERGKIVGWPGGDAVIYPTLGMLPSELSSHPSR